jgi:5-methylcytosine-specific restriction endonuclease McrA
MGGPTSWDNVVAACSPCNVRKDSAMQMKPLRAPKEPTRHEFLAAKRAFPPNFLHETWRDYLYWDVALER